MFLEINFDIDGSFVYCWSCDESISVCLKCAKIYILYLMKIQLWNFDKEINFENHLYIIKMWYEKLS